MKSQLGAMISCPIIGSLLEHIGRKRTMVLITIPFTIGYLLMGLSQNVLMLYAGRFITGVCFICLSIP